MHENSHIKFSRRAITEIRINIGNKKKIFLKFWKTKFLIPSNNTELIIFCAWSVEILCNVLKSLCKQFSKYKFVGFCAESNATLAYFYGPMAFLLFANLILFLYTVARIISVQRDTAILNRAGSTSGSVIHQDRQRWGTNSFSVLCV